MLGVHFNPSVWTLFLGVASTIILVVSIALIKWIHRFIVASVEAKVQVDPQVGKDIKEALVILDTMKTAQSVIKAELDGAVIAVTKLGDELDEIRLSIEKHLSWHEGHGDG